MLRSDDISAVKVIRHYLDELSYCYVNYRLIPDHKSLIFPDFTKLHNLLKGFNHLYRLVFTLFRQGHAAEETILQKILPSDFFEALVTTGMLVQNRLGFWKTPGLAIVPIEGLYLAVSLPPHYPIAKTVAQPVYIGPDSIWLTQALPARLKLAGRRVVDIGTGSGIQSLICASRSASRVVGLEKSKEAVAVARFNVVLNGLSDIVEIRRSNVFSALQEDEVFDFVISNPPFMAVVDNLDYPFAGDGGADGTKVLNNIFADLSAHLSEDAEGLIFCNALGDQYSINFNRNKLVRMSEQQKLFMRAYVISKSPISNYLEVLDKNLKFVCPELTAEAREVKISLWLEGLSQKRIATDYIYEQIIRFWKGRPQGFANLPVYKPEVTDPLVVQTIRARSFA